MSYRDLEMWKLARQAAVDIHRMTLKELPKFEMYEEGSQIRRSVKTIRPGKPENPPRVSRISHPASRISRPVS